MHLTAHFPVLSLSAAHLKLMAVVTSLRMGQSISCLMLPDPLNLMHTHVPSGHYFRSEIGHLVYHMILSLRIFAPEQIVDIELYN